MQVYQRPVASRISQLSRQASTFSVHPASALQYTTSARASLGRLIQHPPKWRRKSLGDRNTAAAAVEATQTRRRASLSHTVGPIWKNPPKISLEKKSWKRCNTLTNFKYEGCLMTGNGNYVTWLKFGKSLRWTYFWRVLTIWNHSGQSSEWALLVVCSGSSSYSTVLMLLSLWRW